MKRFVLTRPAACLAVLLLAACADAPTGVVREPGTAGPALTVYPPPSPSVSNSGGTPLVSWSGLTGATSYAVSFVMIETETNRQTAESQTWTYEYPLGSTSGTSYLDTSNTWTGTHMCTYASNGIVTRYVYRYRVTATFVDGTSTALVNAPVNWC
jgi:hypothetical protein